MPYSTPWKERSTIAQTSAVTLFQQLSGEFNNIGGIASGTASTNTNNDRIMETVFCCGKLGLPLNLAALLNARLQDFAVQYRERYGFSVVATDDMGRPSGSNRRAPDAMTPLRRQAILEALRWGEPCLLLDSAGCLLWAVPLMNNEQVTGGLVVEGVALLRDEERDADDPNRSGRIREACLGLLEMAVSYNLTNASRLRIARQAAEQERFRAEALHQVKIECLDSVREVYLREEPALLAAIKRGERPAAREIINRVLVRIYHLGQRRLDLLKSFVLELVVTMSRAAVESGANPSEVLGYNYRSISDLSALEDEEKLCVWLTEMLERLMDAIRDHREFPNTVLIGRALEYMEKHLDEPMDRETVARAAGLSPSHFSHLMRDKTGRTFTDLVARMRVDRAKALLARTGKTLVQIGAECGFSDQSYFTRVFRKYTGEAPGEYRHRFPGH